MSRIFQITKDTITTKMKYIFQVFQSLKEKSKEIDALKKEIFLLDKTISSILVNIENVFYLNKDPKNLKNELSPEVIEFLNKQTDKLELLLKDIITKRK